MLHATLHPSIIIELINTPGCSSLTENINFFHFVSLNGGLDLRTLILKEMVKGGAKIGRVDCHANMIFWGYSS